MAMGASSAEFEGSRNWRHGGTAIAPVKYYQFHRGRCWRPIQNTAKERRMPRPEQPVTGGVAAAPPVMPPAPPGESPPEAVNRTRLIAEALVELGEDADAVRLVKYLQSRR